MLLPRKATSVMDLAHKPSSLQLVSKLENGPTGVEQPPSCAYRLLQATPLHRNLVTGCGQNHGQKTLHPSRDIGSSQERYRRRDTPRRHGIFHTYTGQKLRRGVSLPSPIVKYACLSYLVLAMLHRPGSASSTQHATRNLPHPPTTWLRIPNIISYTRKSATSFAQ